MLWLVTFAFSKEEDEEDDNLYKLCLLIPPAIFSSNFLLVVTFSHVLHLDVLRRQIELKLKVKTEISLCIAIMQNHPLPSSAPQAKTDVFLYRYVI